MTTGYCKASQVFARRAPQRLDPAADPLLHIEIAWIEQDRFFQLTSFSDYCAYMGQLCPESFESISSDPEVATTLGKLYEKPRDVNCHVGLFCEDRVPNKPLPNLVLGFVALDAFSQALTNPLLSEHIFKPATFSRTGWQAIVQTQRLRDVVESNTKGGASDTYIAKT